MTEKTPGPFDYLRVVSDKSDTDLFERNAALLALRRGHYLRGFAYRFLEECSPALTAASVRAALGGD